MPSARHLPIHSTLIHNYSSNIYSCWCQDTVLKERERPLPLGCLQSSHEADEEKVRISHLSRSCEVGHQGTLEVGWRGTPFSKLALEGKRIQEPVMPCSPHVL